MNIAFKFELILLLLLIGGSAGNLFALEVGDQLPILEIRSGGALVFNKDGELDYEEWSTAKLVGQRRIIQYLPGRYSEGSENLLLNEMVYRIDHPARCRTSSIVNYTDAIWGTQMFIEPRMKKDKRTTPLCDVVLDRKGKGLQRWGLREKNNVTIVINEAGIIEFIHSGKLNKKEIQQIIELTNPEGTISPESAPSSASPFDYSS